MEFDNYGNLWFIDNAGQLGRFNPGTGVFTFFSETNGYYERDYTWYPPITKDQRGNLYTGIGWKTGAHERDWGFDRIYPEKYPL